MRNPPDQHGFTLTEMIMVTAILAVTFLLTVGLIRLLNGTSRQKALIEAQRAAQIVFYDMIKEIKNAQQILKVENGRLVLRSYNYGRFKSHYDYEYLGATPSQPSVEVLPHMITFNLAPGVTPWCPCPPDGPGVYDWESDTWMTLYPDQNQIQAGQDIFREVNIGTVTYAVRLVPPNKILERTEVFNGKSITSTLLKNTFDYNNDGIDYLFKPLDNGTTPYQKVEVSLRVQFKQLQGKSYTYRSQAMMRSGGGSGAAGFTTQ